MRNQTTLEEKRAMMPQQQECEQKREKKGQKDRGAPRWLQARIGWAGWSAARARSDLDGAWSCTLDSTETQPF